jgi:hypothetical protein
MTEGYYRRLSLSLVFKASFHGAEQMIRLTGLNPCKEAVMGWIVLIYDAGSRAANIFLTAIIGKSSLVQDLHNTCFFRIFCLIDANVWGFKKFAVVGT